MDVFIREINNMNLIAKEFGELSTKELYEILKARAKIFIMEQSILYQDMDDVDYKSLHCFFMENDMVAAYLRAFYKDDDKDVVRIGRVLTLQHGNGIGRELMEQSLNVIREKTACRKIGLDAQKYAVGFYEKFGFKTVSDEYWEAGVCHVDMELVFH